MNILLSHSVAPEDGPIASRLKAVTAAYGVRLVLPERPGGKSVRLTSVTRDAIKVADAVVALVTKGAASNDAVARELDAALKAGKPIVALVEGDLQLPKTAGAIHIVRFDRENPSAHETGLVEALDAIARSRRKAADRAKAQLDALAIGALVGIAVGLLALGVVAVATERDEPRVVVR